MRKTEIVVTEETILIEGSHGTVAEQRGGEFERHLLKRAIEEIENEKAHSGQ